jgi:hypothetical protein
LTAAKFKPLAWVLLVNISGTLDLDDMQKVDFSVKFLFRTVELKENASRRRRRRRRRRRNLLRTLETSTVAKAV